MVMSKTLKISEDTHQKLKVYCVQHNIKIQEWVEKCLIIGMKSKNKTKKNKNENMYTM